MQNIKDEFNFSLETSCVQSLEPYEPGQPRVYPLVQSTTYDYQDPDYLAELFDLTKAGHMYSRISNPTVDVFEKKVAALEGGVGAVGVASGQAATTMAILNIMESGDNLISTSTLYGGTHTLLASSMKKLGITTKFVNPNATVEEISALVDDNTKAIFAESLGNPGVNVLDIEVFGKAAKANKIPLIIDNTIATPYLCNPFKHGANIIVHSTTKYIDGQGSAVGGVVVDGGNFDWTASGKFPCLSKPDPDYHGITYTEAFANAAYIVKARTHILRDFGSTMSAFNAFLYNRGLETLHVRMDRHCENATKVAQFLENHPSIEWVNYPTLSSKDHELAKKYLPNGCSGILLFGVKGGKQGGFEFTKGLRWIKNVVHLGDVRTCMLHPASTTHRQLSDEQLLAAGVRPEAIRLNVGIEKIDDILADLDIALKAIDSL